MLSDAASSNATVRQRQQQQQQQQQQERGVAGGGGNGGGEQPARGGGGVFGIPSRVAQQVFEVSPSRDQIWGAVWRLVVVAVAISVAVAVAVASYALLYWLLIPPHTHQSDIFFDYDARGPVYDLPTKGRRVSRNRLAWQPRYDDDDDDDEYDYDDEYDDDDGARLGRRRQRRRRRRQRRGSRGGRGRWGPVATVDFFARHSQWFDFKRLGLQEAPSAAEACSELQLSGFDFDGATDLYADLYAPATPLATAAASSSSSSSSYLDTASSSSSLPSSGAGGGGGGGGGVGGSPYALYSPTASFFLDEYTSAAAGCGASEDCPLMESVPGPRTSAPAPKRSVLTRDTEYSITIDLVLPVSDSKRATS